MEAECKPMLNTGLRGVVIADTRISDVQGAAGKLIYRGYLIEDVKKFNPRCSFPTIIIGEKVIIGYKEKEIKEALGME